MKTNCSICKQDYEELNPENEIFIKSGCQMICYDCEKKKHQQFHDQPERSKREDHRSGCGALNSMET